MIFEKNSNPVSPITRGSTSQKKKDFITFGTNVYKLLQEDGRLKTLLARLDLASLQDKQCICNKIDDIFTATMLYKEKKLAKQSYIMAWSPKYVEHRIA